MIIRSKAPLRLGLAGGGSDVSPYSDEYGGSILNATISLYAYCTIEETEDGKVSLNAPDINTSATYPVASQLPIDGCLDLHKAVYNRIVRDYNIDPCSFAITTYSDAPPGSGLGSSSTMVVAIIKAFCEWFNLPLGEYEMARLAYEVERIDLKLSGGKQDQYAATFGGFNFMEFKKDDQVIVNPLRIKQWVIDELESSIILYYTGASRESAKIIDEQKKNTESKNVIAIEAMHRIKQSSIDMKEAILKGDIASFARILGQAWEDKKKMASSISNSHIDDIFRVAIDAGAITGKISGAGGGGFIIFVVEPTKRINVINALNRLDGRVVDFLFTKGGCHGWKLYQKSLC
ncbi:dehydrogenase [Dysgonomonas sp. 25]|uniref:GHMP family kinase ATP-binding protein n=1 Tax=Dysgonomonas sp. 25 TaxID=2302933 RepID=UPI0013D1CDD5|nr:dehydrogenase [Dysgonomonas sp. 25]NDV69022.1 dehydrogenase [Dysgonomonas sp. 25]